MNSKQGVYHPGLFMTVPRPSPALALAFVITLFVALFAVSGWLTGFGPGFRDPDSMMRLVEVRDFLTGQSWFDLTQYRLDPPAGVLMHWSRYVDAPIAGLIALLEPLAGRANAEVLAADVWPLMLFVPFALGLAAVVHRFAGWTAVFLTMLVIGMSPTVLNLFRPGDIDHHSVQAVLLVWLMAGLVRTDGRRRWAVVAGATAATSIAIGLETLPAVLLAVAGLIAAWIYDGDRWRGGLIVYALTLAAVTTLHFFATVPADRWFAPVCDELSPVYLLAAAVGGVGVAGIAYVFRGRNDGPPGLLMRGSALLTLACFLISLTAILFPACLHGPYGGIDPRIGPIWLDRVSEAQSLWSAARLSPWLVPMFLAPLAATLACLLGLRLVAPHDRPAYAILLFLLVGSILLGCIQLRGLVGAQVLASAGLGTTAANLFRLTSGRDDVLSVGKRWSWALATPVIWLLVGSAVFPANPGASDDRAMEACRGTFARVLGPLRPDVVAATSNFGSYLLFATGHSVLAAPYHRDAAGLLAIDALMTSADGEREMSVSGARYLAVCTGDPELRMMSWRAPGGLAARLIAGERPDWLAVVAEEGPALVLAPVGSARIGADGSVTGSIAPAATAIRPDLGLRSSLAE